MTGKNISEAWLLSLKYCAHLDHCNYFGNCMTHGTKEDAFCSCISSGLDHTCSANSSFPTASALVSEPRDFLYPAIGLAVLAAVVLALLFLVIILRRSSSSSQEEAPPRVISLALKSIDDV